jgi:phosphonate transport system substrate-binding protein
MKRSTLFLAVAVGGLMAGGAARAADCPEGGLRFGVEPYESAQRVLPV